jgi:acetyltransferase-like isoleucine patch superfamily enzyme
MTSIVGELKDHPCGAHFINYELGIKPDIAEGVGFNGVIDCINKVTIEKDAFGAHDVFIITGGHDPNKFGQERKASYGGGPVTIKEGAWIGTRAIIIGPVTIGKHAVIGAGAVINKDVPEYALAVGNPMRVKKFYAH